jgi:predicted nucleic acid-binding protein
MRALLDTDVVLDFLWQREPFAKAAEELFVSGATCRFGAYISAVTPVNVFYLTRKAEGLDAARRVVADLLTACNVCPLTHAILLGAHALPFSDYEDAVQHACASAAGLDAIVIRNLEDYKGSTLQVFAPADFLEQLKRQQP